MRQKKEGFSKADLKLRKWLFLFPKKKFGENISKTMKKNSVIPHTLLGRLLVRIFFMGRKKREVGGKDVTIEEDMQATALETPKGVECQKC